MEETKKTGVGSIIATIIIIALILLGGLYFWGKRMEEAKNIKQITNEQDQTPPLTLDEQEAASIRNTSTSDELDAIENDLKRTNLDNLDSELK